LEGQIQNNIKINLTKIPDTSPLFISICVVAAKKRVSTASRIIFLQCKPLNMRKMGVVNDKVLLINMSSPEKSLH